jgi:2-methylcitrate synthase
VADRGGLEGVVVARTRTCEIDGERGILRYAGYDVRELAAGASYEEVAFLLLNGRLPTAAELDAFDARLRAARSARPEPWTAVADVLARAGAPPIEVLRSAVSADAGSDPLAGRNTPEANLDKAIALVARLPVMAARAARMRAGRAPLPPDPALGHAADFLRMLTGEAPSPQAARTLDAALIVHADHEMNASTFAARVVASTLAGMHAALTAALGALGGALHGGANEHVMRLLEEIGTPDRAAATVEAKLAAGERVMGFGHRVYRGADPRALVLRDLVAGLDAGRPWLALAEPVAAAMARARGLHPNVDFYSAPAYRALGIPTDAFPAVFAVSRCAGWAAHVIEQHADNRLIRPSAEYVGPPARPFLPLERRRRE